MKILLVHNTYQDRGGEDVVFDQERDLLRSAGHEVWEYVRHNREISQYSIARKLTLVARTVWASDSYREFNDVLRRKRPDIVHIHNTFPLISPSVYWACRKHRLAVVQTLHNYRMFCPGANFFRDGEPCEDCLGGSFWRGVGHGCYRNSRKETAAVALMLSLHHAGKTFTRMVDRYIVLTAFARDRFISAGIPAAKILVKPNCVDPDPGVRQGGSGDYALYVGRVSEEKGVPTVVRAWGQLPRTIPLKIIGDGPARAGLQTEAQAQGLNNITFCGQQSRKEVTEAMKGARFLVFSSELYENLPLTIIEAFACGLPVLASRRGAMQEIIEEGKTGHFFLPGNAEHLAKAVLDAWHSPEHLRELGEQARREYEAKYTAAVGTQRLIEIYQQILQDRNNTQAPAALTLNHESESAAAEPTLVSAQDMASLQYQAASQALRRESGPDFSLQVK